MYFDTPPLLSRSSTKPRGSKIHACSHSDLGEFLFWWRILPLRWKNRKILIRFLEFPSVKFLKLWQKIYSLLAFLAFNFSEKFVRQGFRAAKKHKNAKNEKTTLTTPTFFDIKSFLLPDYTRFEHIRKFYWGKLKKIEIKTKQTSKNGDVWVVLIWDLTVALIRKIAKRTRILTLDWGHWRALRDLA